MAHRSRIAVTFTALSLLALGAVGGWLYLWQRAPANPADAEPVRLEPTHPGGAVAYRAVPIGLPADGHPVVPQVAIADLDSDGLQDVLVCDATANRIGWIRQSPTDVFTESWIGERVPAPGRVTVADFNQDGRPDVLVASLGSITPTNDRIGRVVVLENLGAGKFRNHVLVEDVFRVVDACVADVDGDGRPDVVMSQAGLAEGEVRWLANRGDWSFADHPLLARSGVGALAPADYDGDGDVDLAVLCAGERDEVRLLRQGPQHSFEAAVIWQADRPAWGGSGLVACDLNRDGAPDLLLANGTSRDSDFPEAAPWHGLHWLENRAGEFAAHLVGAMPGCFSPVAVDLDGDGDVDVVSVSAVNQAFDPDAVRLMAWLNDGRQQFRTEPLAHDPSRLSCVAAGDIEDNGAPMLVTGGIHADPPFTRMSRVTLWRRTLPPLP